MVRQFLARPPQPHGELVLGCRKFLHRIRRRREATSALQQLRLFNCLAQTMAWRLRSAKGSFQGGRCQKSVEKSYTCPVAEVYDRAMPFADRKQNSDIYDKCVIWHTVCFIFSIKKHVARSLLAAGSERRVLNDDLPTDSAYREETPLMVSRAVSDSIFCDFFFGRKENAVPSQA